MTKPKAPAPKFTLSPDDLVLLHWLDEWRLASVPLIAALRDTTMQAVYYRLKRLGTGPGGLGLIEGADVVAGWYRVFYLTRKGQARIESPYATTTPQLSRIAHDLAVAEVCGVRGTLAGWGAITSERAIAREVYLWRTDLQAQQREWEKRQRRRESGPAVPPKPGTVGPWVGLPGGRTHTPDSVIRRDEDGSLIALEVELSMKDDRRIREILTAFANDDRFVKVLYYTSSEAIAKKIKAITADINATAINTGEGGTVQVRTHLYTPAHSTKYTPPPKKETAGDAA
ncbi:hypothetical protein [Actinoplanes sp. NPDC049802]|uniref:hypothetical protein n=1 Tax=Actinoplanes sp. NPDC049802 TaxID=3154742 RepID=UPI00340EBC70